MGRVHSAWLSVALLLATVAYVLAEDITLTTYYPSPRGVYNELRVGSGAGSLPSATLQVTKPTDDGNFAVRVDDQAGGDATPFIIDQNGNVGIGTSDPVLPLHVNGSILGSKNLYFQVAGGGPNVFGIGELVTANADWPAVTLGVNLFGIGWDSVTGSIGINIPAGTTLGVTGNFAANGFGNFNGNGAFTGNVAIGGNLTVSNVNASGTVFAASDARLKANILPVAGVLEKLDQLHGVSFEWNELHPSSGSAPSARHLGVVAQDVEAAFPELVTSWGEQGYKAVDYGGLTAVLLEAVKELQQELASQQQRIEALEAQLGRDEAGEEAPHDAAAR